MVVVVCVGTDLLLVDALYWGFGCLVLYGFDVVRQRFTRGYSGLHALFHFCLSKQQIFEEEGQG